MNAQPVLIAVAPNGARLSQKDHPKLPISPLELAETALACCEAGATMLHLHVRDEAGGHSLDPQSYRAAIREVSAAVGDRLLIQVTSEAAGVYQPAQQMSAMLALQPRCVSLGLREIIRDEQAIDAGAGFLTELTRQDTLIQYILYSPEDIQWYLRLRADGVIPTTRGLVLLVLGRYGAQQYEAAALQTYLDTLQQAANWMVCAFGTAEPQVMAHAIAVGGHARVGFENNRTMPDGSIASDNTALVKLTALAAQAQGRPLATLEQAEALFAG